MAGFFKKLFKKNNDDSIVKKISEKNVENRVIKESKEQSLFNNSLKKSSSAFSKAIDEIIRKEINIDDELFDSIEEMLISYDVGYNATSIIVEDLRDEIINSNIKDFELIKELLIDKIFTYYISGASTTTNLDLLNDRTNVIVVCGVNGVGKTTSIAKIAKYFIDQKKKVLLVAGDTFRAGAVEQLKVWSDKLNADIVVPHKEGLETATVIYEGVKKGYEEKYDLVICDTSGRLQNKTNLMNELKKIFNVIKKFDKDAPHETLLVLDATTGQSGLNQAKAFNDVSELSGIVLAKMDSTSRGGIVLAIKDLFNIPVKFIGLGESLDDLSVFDLEKFVDGMVSEFGK